MEPAPHVLENRLSASRFWTQIETARLHTKVAYLWLYLSKFYCPSAVTDIKKVTFLCSMRYDNYNNIREKYTALVVLNQA